MRKKLPDHWQFLARIGQLPSHQHHQGKTEEQKKQPGESVLDTDHFVVGGKNILPPPPKLVMFTCRAGAVRRRVLAFVRVWIVMSRCCGKRSGSVHLGEKLLFQYLERLAICKARNFANPRRFSRGG